MDNERAIKRILVLDDDPGIQHLIWTVLKHRGFSVAVASDPNHARQKMKAERFEMLVTDHDMPCENGLSFVRKMRKGDDVDLGKHHRNIPVVMVSARNGPEYVQAVKAAGVQALVQKPFLPSAFVKLIEQLATSGNDGKFISLQTMN